MKKLVTTVVLLAGAASVYSQGQINSSDYNESATGFNIHIWSPNPAAPSVEQTGNSPATISGNANYNANPDFPAGAGPTGGYGGTRVGGAGRGVTPAAGYANGDNFNVELYAALGTVTTFSTSTFTAVQSLGTLDDAAFGPTFAGMYSGGGLLTLNGANGTIAVPSGSAVTLAVAAWYNNNGTVTSYPGVSTPGSGIISGVSSLGTENTGVNPNPPPFLPTTANGGNPGISSFSLTTTSTVPEPSTIALGVIGASAFLMRLRRKN
jgi:hypothetical protein